MPSLENLKKFSEDMSQIGDEFNTRRSMGTTVPEVEIPDNVPQEDDSYDFEFGLPENLPGEDSVGKNEQDDSDVDDILNTLLPNANAVSEAEDVTDIFTADTDDENPLNDFALPDDDLATTADNDMLPGLDDFGASDLSDTVADFDIPDDFANINEASDMSAMQADDVNSLDDFALPGDENPLGDFALPDDINPLDDFSLPGDDVSASDTGETFVNLDDFGTDSLIDDVSNDFADTIEAADTFTTQSTGEDSFDDFSNVSQDDGFDGFGDFDDSSQAVSLDDDFSGVVSEDSLGMGAEQDMYEIDNAIQDFDLNSFDDVDDNNFSEQTDSFAADFDDTAFEIPGFSDADAVSSAKAPVGLLKKKKSEDTDDSRDHLTDSEYELFKANLKTYPLNLRLAIDKVIVNNEFTDDAIMEVLFKIVKKVPARKLASHIEKMLDIAISIPLNYERRTVEQYEAYKLSLEYQLKNRIIPLAIASLAAGIVLYILFYFISTFVYRPIMAEVLYNEGYALIENDLYEQSELKFDQALTFSVKKKWFFRYAQAYRDKNQYERARTMYEQLVLRFNYDKQAGLEYARMEKDDLENYERAEFITKRYILDYHINDKDAKLLLGDIYLDWATSLPAGEQKNTLFESARLEYATLIDLYGSSDLYLSRMLRYFIRTDNLRQVLGLHTYFMNQKKLTLEAQDLTDLGGYLLEKRYGYLPPADEFLRSNIENLRVLLETAIDADPTIPEAHYNLGKYLIYTENFQFAIIVLNNALNAFAAAEKQSHERILRYIDTSRLLGEIYTEQEEYILAEEQFADGIRLFEEARITVGLSGNEDVGKLYSDMADIDYFISDDLDVALTNYLHAIENYYDTPSIRYRIGFIRYNAGNYAEALNSFIKTATDNPSDRNLLLALGNVLSVRDDNSAAAAHYERLLEILDADRARYGIFFPQVRTDHAEIVDLYLKVSNNLGVTFSRLADQNGNATLESRALGYFEQSLRAWDALTRNQETMVRLEGSNLAEQNIRYLLYPMSDFEPAIYAAIPRVLYGENMLTQSALY
ncbi:MAG: tetratricopeptide repeat protein [Spirochaetales bacterium]